jgi:hypothetical protein
MQTLVPMTVSWDMLMRTLLSKVLLYKSIDRLSYKSFYM